jgi:hypothetical protein
LESMSKNEKSKFRGGLTGFFYENIQLSFNKRC